MRSFHDANTQKHSRTDICKGLLFLENYIRIQNLYIYARITVMSLQGEYFIGIK